jgi:hypothetical protein
MYPKMTSELVEHCSRLCKTRKATARAEGYSAEVNFRLSAKLQHEQQNINQSRDRDIIAVEIGPIRKTHNWQK